MKIMLDAGHAGNQNTPAYFPAYCEAKRMWQLYLYLKAALVRCGIEVGETRTDQGKDKEVYTRGKMAAGYDLFLSLHSNAISPAPNDAVDRPVIIHYLDAPDADKSLAQKLGDAIKACIGAKQATQLYTRRGNNGEYYGVLRGAKAARCPTAFILEHGFHTCTETAKWLLSDDNLKLLAEEEAKVVCAHYGIEYKGGDTPTPPAPPPPPPPAPTASVSLRVYANGRYLPWVRDNEDYAGNLGQPVTGVQCGSSIGEISYRVKLRGSVGYLPWVTQYNDTNDGYAGIKGKPIDALQMSSNILGYKVVYCVHLQGGSWLPWVTEYGSGADGYAGIKGRVIDAIGVKLERK